MVQHTSEALPHSTAISVAVTHSSPPSATACTAESSSVHGVPYGSRSTTSNSFSCVIMTRRASAWCATTAATASPPNALLRRMAAAATGSMSLATTTPTCGTSCA